MSKLFSIYLETDLFLITLNSSVILKKQETICLIVRKENIILHSYSKMSTINEILNKLLSISLIE